MPHCYHPKAVNHHFYRIFWLLELKKFVCMIRSQLHCLHVVWSLPFSFFLANGSLKCEPWTNSIGVKSEGAVLMLSLCLILKCPKMDCQAGWSKLAGFPFEKLDVFLAFLSALPNLIRCVQEYKVLHCAAPNWFLLVLCDHIRKSEGFWHLTFFSSALLYTCIRFA